MGQHQQQAEQGQQEVQEQQQQQQHVADLVGVLIDADTPPLLQGRELMPK